MANSVNKYALPIHPAQYVGTIKASQVKDIIEATWNSPYPACPITEPDLVNMTYGQVAVYKQVYQAAHGDGQAFDRVVDRMIGRPMQVNQNLNVNKSYKDFCLDLAKEEGILDADIKRRGQSGADDPSTLE